MKRLFAALPALLLAAAAPAPDLVIKDRIPGPDGSWDYASVDPATRTLFVAHDGVAMAVDLASGKARTIGVFARAHAVVPLPGGLLLVTSGRDDSVRLLTIAEGREIARIAVDKDPDAAFYDPKSRQAVVVNAKAGTIALIDPAARRVTRTIALKPGLEFAQLADDGTLFVNNEDLNEVETVDLASGKPGAAIAMPGCEGPTGLGYDPRTARLISACGNGVAVVIDAKARKVVGITGIGKGADAVIVDSARRLAYIPCGRDGVVEVFALDAADGPKHVATASSEAGARTGAVDPRTGWLYLPSASFRPAEAGTRPAILPGTFRILVMGPR